jgi:hypothetical protein
MSEYQALTEYVRSPSSVLVDVTANPIFLLTVPDKNPRTECGCQPVAFISSLAVAPPGRFSRSRTLAVLLPSRADLAFFWPLGAFFGALAFLADLAFFGGTWARCRATRAFLLGFGWSPVAVAWAVPVSSAIDVFISFSPCAVITAVTTWITPVRWKSKWILKQAMEWRCCVRAAR